MGAAWATLISLSAIGLARVIEVKFLLKIFPFNRLLFKPILAGITAWLGLRYIQPFVIHQHTLITLLCAGSFCLMIYGLTLWILKLEPEDKDFISGIGIIGNSLKGKS